MALIKCKNCKGDISSAAKACPHCGKLVPHIDPGDVVKVVVSLLVAWCIYYVFSGSGSPSAPVPPAPTPAASAPAPPLAASEPSFDCNNAHSQSERMICADAELSTLDADFGMLYKKARSLASDMSAFVRANRSEWQRRENTCFDKACLIDWYAQRKLELSKVIANAAALLNDHPSNGSAHEAAKPELRAADKASELQAAFQFDGSRLRVSNIDGFFWTTCRIDLNAHGFSHGYSLTVPKIGDPIYLDVREFATSSGERFNPFELQLLSVDIACDTPNGRELFSGQMDPM